MRHSVFIIFYAGLSGPCTLSIRLSKTHVAAAAAVHLLSTRELIDQARRRRSVPLAAADTSRPGQDASGRRRRWKRKIYNIIHYVNDNVQFSRLDFSVFVRLCFRVFFTTVSSTPRPHLCTCTWLCDRRVHTHIIVIARVEAKQSSRTRGPESRVWITKITDK